LQFKKKLTHFIQFILVFIAPVLIDVISQIKDGTTVRGTFSSSKRELSLTHSFAAFVVCKGAKFDTSANYGPRPTKEEG
jgi:hypothetical protein